MVRVKCYPYFTKIYKYMPKTERIMAEIRADRSENVKYNSSEIRVYVKRGRLSSYPGFPRPRIGITISSSFTHIAAA